MVHGPSNRHFKPENTCIWNMKSWLHSPSLRKENKKPRGILYVGRALIWQAIIKNEAVQNWGEIFKTSSRVMVHFSVLRREEKCLQQVVLVTPSGSRYTYNYTQNACKLAKLKVGRYWVSDIWRIKRFQAVASSKILDILYIYNL